MICWGNLSLSKIIGGGAPRTAASFYSANMCIQGGNTDKQNSFQNPLHLARGPLDFWRCKIDSLNQNLTNILKIVMRANEPSKGNPGL